MSVQVEKLNLGKYKRKNILIVGKSQTGKRALVQCLFLSSIESDTEMNVSIFTPTQCEPHKRMNKSADAIILCIRLDDQFRIEDQEVIIQLKKRFGKEFLNKTLIVFTMSNKVQPIGAHKCQHSLSEFLKTVRNELMDVVMDAFQKQKLHLPMDLRQRLVLAGAPDVVRENRMIPDVESCDDSQQIDWTSSVAQALLDMDT